MRVVGISGSLRAESYNTQLLQEISTLLAIPIEMASIENIPPYNEEIESQPPKEVEELRRKINQAEALIIATPEYNGSIPGHLKNALDWLSRPFEANPIRNMPVAIFGSSTGMFGAVWAQADLKRVISTMGGKVIGDEEIPIGFVHQRQPLLGDDIRPLVKARLQILQSALAPA